MKYILATTYDMFGYRVRYSIYHVAFHTNLAAEFTDDAGNGKPSQR